MADMQDTEMPEESGIAANSQREATNSLLGGTLGLQMKQEELFHQFAWVFEDLRAWLAGGRKTLPPRLMGQELEEALRAFEAYPRSEIRRR